MTQIPSSSESRRDSFFRQLPYVNLYQYPPPKPATLDEQLSLAGKLALDQAMISIPSLFTIFVSIPYCRSRCNSCRFFKGLLPPNADVHALLDDNLDHVESQIQRYAATVRFSSARCGAVYLGGGTASLLASDQVNRLVHTLRDSFSLDSDIEITLEGNPRELTLEYLQEVKGSGVTRVSLGFQSAQDIVLKKMLNSPHNGITGLDAVKNALVVGFDTVNIDMLYRIPGQTVAHWREDLQTALNFGTESITIYSYIVDPGSPAEHLIVAGRLKEPVDMDTAHEWYISAKELFEQHGYVEHRKGNFSKPGHEQRYGTLSYTKGHEILGLGAGAYSFINQYQFNAPDQVDLYKQQIRGGFFPPVSKLSARATDRNMMERYTIFSFFASSLNRRDFSERFGQDPLAVFPDSFSKLERLGLVVINDEVISLTELGKKWRSNIFYEFYSDSFK